MSIHKSTVKVQKMFFYRYHSSENLSLSLSLLTFERGRGCGCVLLCNLSYYTRMHTQTHNYTADERVLARFKTNVKSERIKRSPMSLIPKVSESRCDEKRALPTMCREFLRESKEGSNIMKCV
jgi:hypothetical protein